MDVRRTTIGLLLATTVGLTALTGCGDRSAETPRASLPAATDGETVTPPHRGPEDTQPVQLTSVEQAGAPPTQAASAAPVEVLIKTSMGEIRVRLDREKAPRTVENFLYNYVERGFYDQTIVHYVEEGYLIAAGGYNTEYEYLEPRTPILCEANNGLKNCKGTIGMAHHPDYVNSANSQFYINLVDNPGLDYEPTADGTINGYCVFGEVIEGMDVVEQIAAVEVHDQDEFVNTPVQPVIIESVRCVR